MRIVEAARRGFKSVAQTTTGGIWPWLSGQTSGGKDWNREAGLRFDNSIVYAAIQYAVSSLTSVDVYVRKERSDGEYDEVKGHPIVELLDFPNPWYDWTTLVSGWVISELAGRGGISYTYKHRSAAGKVVGLEFLPEHAVMPYSAPRSGNFIDYYRVTVAGGYMEVQPENILSQRFGPINPWRPQVSIGPLEAALLEVVTDKQAANFTAAMLYNVGVTPHLISPNATTADGKVVQFTKEHSEGLERVWREKITGDNRGRPIISQIPVKVDNLSFSPNDMNLEAIRNINEERICAALRIPPHALGLGTGLENSNNRASAEAVAKQAARDFVVPYMRRKAAQLTKDLIPELGEDGEEVCFRIDAIEALQEDKSETAKRITTLAGGAVITKNEGRKMLGFDPIDGGDELATGPPQNGFDGDDDKEKDQGKKVNG